MFWPYSHWHHTLGYRRLVLVLFVLGVGKTLPCMLLAKKRGIYLPCYKIRGNWLSWSNYMSRPSVSFDAEQTEVYLILYILVPWWFLSCSPYQNTPKEQVKLYLSVQRYEPSGRETSKKTVSKRVINIKHTVKSKMLVYVGSNQFRQQQKAHFKAYSLWAWSKESACMERGCTLCPVNHLPNCRG